MSILILDSNSAGAPSLYGTNGRLCTVLDWLLAQKSWEIEYTATNARVYRAATGRRRRFFVAHDSAIAPSALLATIRGAEDATAATPAGLVDPFPTVAQSSNILSTFMVSDTAGTSPRYWQAWVGDTHIMMIVATIPSSAQTGWDIMFFGDPAGTEADDTYGTMIWVGGSSSAASSQRAMSACGGSGVTALAKTFWCRNRDGSQKSSYGGMQAGLGGAQTPCTYLGATTMRAGYNARIRRGRISFSCSGSSLGSVGILGIPNRGWIPNLWAPEHASIGSVSSADVFSDSEYNPAALFRIAPCSPGSAGCVIVETTDTWTLPT